MSFSFNPNIFRRSDQTSPLSALAANNIPMSTFLNSYWGTSKESSFKEPPILVSKESQLKVQEPKVEKEELTEEEVVSTTTSRESEEGEVTDSKLEALRNELDEVKAKLNLSTANYENLKEAHDLQGVMLSSSTALRKKNQKKLKKVNTELKNAKRDLYTAQNNIGFRDLLMGSAVTGYAVVANWSGMVSAFTAGTSYIAGTVPGQYMGAAASMVSAKTATATSWLASTKIAVAVSPEVVKSVLGGSKVSVLGTVSAVYGAVFTIAVNFLSMPIDIVLEKSKYLKKHRFTRQLVSHALAGATLYGVSAGIAKVGVTAAAISAPGAAILTVAALATYLFIEKIHFSAKTSN